MIRNVLRLGLSWLCDDSTVAGKFRLYTRVRFETGGRVSGLHAFWLVQDLGTIN